MNKKYSSYNLAEMIAQKSGIEIDQAILFIEVLIELIEKGIKNDHFVKVKALGTFKVMLMKERESVHINTGKRIIIPAYHKLVFIPDKNFKEQINKPFSFFETIETTVEDDKIANLNFIQEKEIEEDSYEERSDKEPEAVVESQPIEEEKRVLDVQQAEEEGGEKDHPVPTITDSESNRAEENEPIPIERIISDVPEEELDGETSTKSVVKVKQSKKKKKSNRGLFIIFFLLLFLLVGAVYYYFVDAGIIHSYLQKPTNDYVFSLPKDTLEEGTEKTLPDSTAMIPALDEVLEEDPKREQPAEAPKPEAKKISTPEKRSKPTVENRVIATVSMEPGERLTLIAEKYYGNKIFWVYLYEYNKANIEDPDRIPTGMKILVPNKEQYNIDANNAQSVEKARKLQSQIVSKKK